MRRLLDEAQPVFEPLQKVAARAGIDAHILRIGVELGLGKKQPVVEGAGRADVGQEGGGRGGIHKIVEDMGAIPGEIVDGRVAEDWGRSADGGHGASQNAQNPRPPALKIALTIAPEALTGARDCASPTPG